MPVKSSREKSGKKDNSKKSAKKKVASKSVRKKAPSKKIKRDIARAVANIPDLVIRETQATGISGERETETFTAPTQTPGFVPPKHPVADIYHAPKNANLLLWTGVGIVTLVILVMWSFNIKSFVLTTTEQGASSADSEVLGTAKSDIEQILDDILKNESETDQQLDEIKETLKEELNKPDDKQQAEDAVAQSLANILVASASSTPTTSTPN